MRVNVRNTSVQLTNGSCDWNRGITYMCSYLCRNGFDHWDCDGLHHGSGMDPRPTFAHHRVETVHWVCCIVHCTDAAIWLHQAVLSLHYVSFSLLGLLLDVACVLVVHSIVKCVAW